MPTKKMSSENKDLRKQIGCMTSIFHNFLTGRRISSHNPNRLLLAAQDQPESQHATRTLIEKDSESQKEKPRTSVESSRASFSSSCSSTFSSNESQKTTQPEKYPSRQSLTQMNTIKEEAQTHDFRDLVKESMHRETRGLSIKYVTNGETKGQPMKHIDSPRPLKPKASNDGSTRILVKDERLALPRFSYDGRESRETWKSKSKELPRLSLDSKSSSIKSSESKFLRQGPRMENENSSIKEPGSQPRSSVVAKLMGLDNFPETVSTPKINSCVKEAFPTSPSIPSEKNMKTQGNDVSSPSPPLNKTNSVKKLSQLTKLASFPTEPAPWRLKDSKNKVPKNVQPLSSSVSSPSPPLNKTNSVKKLSQLTKLASFPTEPAPWRLKDSKNKVPKNVQPLSSSVYGEIEKRITQLEFRKLGKDLGALKQILDAMQKTRERMESETVESAGFLLQRRPSPQTRLGSSIVIMKPAKVQVTGSSKVPATDLQKIRIWDHGEDIRGQEVKDIAPRKYNLKNQRQHLPPSEKKNLSKNLELQRTLRSSKRVNVENCATTGRNIGALSQRPQKSDSERVKRHPSKKPEDNGLQRRKLKVKAKDLNTSYEQLSELSSDTRYSSYQSDTVSIKSESNYSQASQMETEANSTSTNQHEQNYLSTSKEDITSVELVVAMTEQPSPVSVLNGAFYSEDSPSPVKKMSTVFQDDTASPDEAEWHLEKPNPLMPRKKIYNGYEFNHKLDYMKNLIYEFTLTDIEPDKTAPTQTDERHGPDNSYIDMIFQSLGFLKDGSFLEEGAKEERDWKEYREKFNQKREINLVLDTVNEIMCRKIKSARLFTMARKRTSPHGLLKEIHSEIGDLQTMPNCNDDEEDGFIRLFMADLKHQSEDWADYSSEVPSLVLDIERLVFKDLINEVVTGRYGYH